MNKIIVYTILAIGSTLVLASCDLSSASQEATPDNSDTAIKSLPKYSFNGQGELKRLDSDNYRRWIYVGTPLTPNDMNEPEAAFPEFHNVYIYPDDYDYWMDHGRWQDGTILVKELVLVGKKQEVSGNGYFMGDFTGLEVTIKDKKLYPNEPGNWAYFSFGHSYPLAETASAFPTGACNSCHETSAADDFVFTQNYPILRAAKNARNATTGYFDTEGGLKAGELLDENMENEMISFLSE